MTQRSNARIRHTVYEVGPNGRRLGDVQYAVIDLLMRTRLPIERLEVIRRLSTELPTTRQAVRSAIVSLLMYEYIVEREDLIVKVQIQQKERPPRIDKRPQNVKK